MKIKTILKTTAAVATLMMGSQTWGAGVWYNADTGIAFVSNAWGPTTEEATAFLSAGNGSTSATAISPTSDVKTLNINVANQTGTSSNALTVNIPADDLVINLTTQSSSGNTFLLTLDGAYKATVNLLKGDVTLAAPLTASYQVNVQESLTLTPGTNAQALSYKVAANKTLTLGSAFVQTTAGRMKFGKESLVITPNSGPCTIRLD